MFGPAIPIGFSSRGAISTTARRLYWAIFLQASALWYEAIARLPRNKKGTGAHLTQRFRMDEDHFIRLLAEGDSSPCLVKKQLRLRREIIKQVARTFRFPHVKQVAFGNIVCAARFRSFGGGDSVLFTLCAHCRGASASLDHLLPRLGLGIPRTDFDGFVSCLVDMTARASKGNPELPTPIPPSHHGAGGRAVCGFPL